MVTDYLCDETLYAGNANAGADLGSCRGRDGYDRLARRTARAGHLGTFTFDARIRELPAPDCEATNRSCKNRVSVSTFCGGGGRATD